jgi:hypothetical protein
VGGVRDEKFNLLNQLNLSIKQVKEDMSINRIAFSLAIICSLISGCEGGEELKDSVEGDELVTSAPVGIFSSDTAKNFPAKPAGLIVSAMSSSVFLVQWKAPPDSTTAQENLRYKLYVSTDEAHLLVDASLVALINGSLEKSYSYDLDIGALGLLFSDAKYHVAIIAVDDDGYESTASIATDLELMTEELQLRADIVIQSVEELGLTAPAIINSGDGLEYIYSNVPLTISVPIGSYIAQLVKKDGVEFHELLRVVTVTNDGFRAVEASIFEVMAAPYTLSGSATLDSYDEIEPGAPAQNQTSPDR